jgi:hypothetical protein
MFKTLTLAARRILPWMDIALLERTKERTEIEDPRCAYCRTDTHEPILAKDRSEQEDPKSNSSLTVMLLPNWVKLLTESDEPKMCDEKTDSL